MSCPTSVASALVAVLCTLGATSCSEGEPSSSPATRTETAADSGECDDEALRIPVPRLASAQIEAPMDLLFIEHRGCGYNADGEVQFGLEPAVLTTDGRVEIDVPSAFDVRYSISSADDEDAPLADAAAARVAEVLTVDVPDAGCHRLVVELTRGDLTGRFVSLLQASDGCTPRASSVAAE